MRGMFTSFGLAFAVGLGAEAVAASSVPATTIMTYDRAVFDGSVAGFPTTIVEDFETFATGETTGGLATAVGVFDTLGPAGSGGTVTGTAGNSGTGLYVRDRGVYGRSNTTAAGRSYLDSNDTYGLGWTIAGLGRDRRHGRPPARARLRPRRRAVRGGCAEGPVAPRCGRLGDLAR